MILYPLIVAVAAFVGLWWIRKPGRGGALGRMIRRSDHASWKDAVEDRQIQLAELRLLSRPRGQPWSQHKRRERIIELEQQLDYLRKHEPPSE